jgi:hypothetical protein
MKWADIRGSLGENYTRHLSDLNDKDGKSFPQIADFIETEPEGLFTN